MNEERLRAALALAGLAGRKVTRTHLGVSGDLVARAGDVVVKLALGAPAARLLEREAAAMAWLGPPAPPVVWSGATPGGFALVTGGLAGRPASDSRGGEAALAAVARGLSELHARPTEDCPFDQRLERRLAEAAERVAAGLVDPGDFDAERRASSPAEVLELARRGRPADEDLVIAHGDASLPNFLVRGGRLSGMVDLGRLGVADRHWDLAIFLRSAARNHPGLDARAILAAHYGGPPPDAARLAYYGLLDELF